MPNHARLVAYLSIFTALSGIFFLTQSQEITNKPAENINYPVSKTADNILGTWDSGGSYSQTSWVGGTSSAVFTIPWGSSGGWDKYQSLSNLTINSSGIIFTPGSQGEFFSSVLDTGSNSRAGAISYDASPLYGAGNPAISLRGASTPDGVLSASWGYCQVDHRYVQYRLLSDQYNQTETRTVTKVSVSRAVTNLYGFVYDPAGKKLDGVKISISNPSRSNLSGPLGKNLTGLYYISFNFDPSITTYTVTASKSGYKSQTKTVSTSSASNNNCAFDLSVDFNLTKEVSSSPSISNEKPTPINETPMSITQVALPKSFIQPGSGTTDLAKISDPKAVKDFTLENVSKHRIVFNEPIDLSNEGFIEAVTKLDQYVKTEQIGIVEVDSEKVPFLNKRATIVMYNLPFNSTPKVLVDGKINPEVVSNINYKNKTLTFNVSHFSKFEAVENKTEPTTIVKTNYTNISVGVVLILTAVLLGSGYWLYKHKKFHIKPV